MTNFKVSFYLTLLLFYVGYQHPCIAQMEIGSIDLDNRSINELTPIADDEGNTGLYYTHNSQLYFLVLSPNQEVTLSKTYHRPDATFLGTKITDRSFIFYFQNNLDKKELYAYTLSKVNTTSHVQNVLFTDSSQEETVIAITENKDFYIITAEKNTNFVHVYNFQDTESFKKITFVTDMPDVYKRLKKADFKHVRFDFNQTAYTGHFKEKVYLYKKRICFSMHRYDQGSLLEKTEILMLDLETEKCQYHDVIHSRKGFDRFSNSFLFEDYLFYVKSNRNKLDIHI